MGGSIGLLLRELSSLRTGLAGLGILAAVILSVAAHRQDRRIRLLLPRMKERTP